MNKNYDLGFTLLELLVGMLIIAVVLSALTSFFSQSSQVSAQIGTRSDLQQDTLNAQQLITGRLREAFYVMPPGQTIVLSSTAGSKNAPTYNNPTAPRYGTSTWLTGTDPMLAMVLSPADGTAGQNCTLTTTTKSTTGNNSCYSFYAYYPVNRQSWINGTSNSNQPASDSMNSNAWVLVQYKAYLSRDFATAEVPNINVSVPDVVDYINYVTANAQLLADYIEPTINDATTIGLTNSLTPYSMFSYANSSSGPITSSTTTPVDTVTVNLAAARLLSNKLIRLPDPTNEYSLTVNLTNQGKVAAQ